MRGGKRNLVGGGERGRRGGEERGEERGLVGVKVVVLGDGG